MSSPARHATDRRNLRVGLTSTPVLAVCAAVCFLLSHGAHALHVPLLMLSAVAAAGCVVSVVLVLLSLIVLRADPRSPRE